MGRHKIQKAKGLSGKTPPLIHGTGRGVKDKIDNTGHIYQEGLSSVALRGWN